MTATLTKLHLCPQLKTADHFCFKDRQRTSYKPAFYRSGLGVQKGRYGLCVQPCRSFKGDDVNEDKDTKEDDMKLKKEYGFWSSLKGVVFGFGESDSQSNYDYSEALAKVEEVFHSVSLLISNVNYS